MKCPACGWKNPPSYTACFSCDRPLEPAQADDAPAADTLPVHTGASVPAAGPIVEAGFGPRLVATLVDATLMLVPGATLLFFALPRALTADEHAIGLSLAVLLGAACALCLPALLDAFSAGSLGRRLAGIRLVTNASRRPGLPRAMLRHLLKYMGHLLLPLVLRLVGSMVLRGRSLHDVVARTHVVNSHAGEAGLHPPRRRLLWLGSLCGLSLAVAAGVAVQALSLRDDTAHPTRHAVGHLVRVAKSYTLLLQHHQRQTGAFPPDIDALRAGTLPAAIRALHIDPVSGTFTVTAAQPPIDGLHIRFVPEFRQRDGRVTVRRWHCSSSDIPRNDLPSTCDDPP